jgi:hypothetical protein
MKPIPLILLFALTAPAFSQTSVPIQAEAPLTTAPTLSPITNAPPAPNTETYQNQIRSRYRLPYPSSANPMARWGGQDLIVAIDNATRLNIPTDVIQNLGNARPRFLQDTQAARKALNDSIAASTLAADKVAALREQKANVLLDLEVKEAKVKYIQGRIDELSSRIKDQIDTDDILKALKRLEAARREQLVDQERHLNVGIETPGTIATAQAEVAAVSIDIARRRTEISSTAFGGALDTLNKLLVEVSLDVEELKATVKAIDARLATAEKAVSTDQQVRKLTAQLNALQHLQDVEQNLQPPPKP